MPNVIFPTSFLQSGDSAFASPTLYDSSWVSSWDVGNAFDAAQLPADIFLPESPKGSILSLDLFSTPAAFYDVSQIIRLYRPDEAGVLARLEFLAQINFNTPTWEKKRHHWIVLAEHLKVVLSYFDENSGYLDWPFHVDGSSDGFLHKARDAFEEFDSKLTKVLALWAEDFALRLSEKEGRAALSLEGFSEYVKFREFVAYLDRQGFASAYFRARQDKSAKSFADIVRHKINLSKEKLMKEFEAARLNEVLGLDPKADVSGIVIHESWQELWRAMAAKTWDVAATAYFSPLERRSFLRKVAQWECHQDEKLANQALHLYKNLKTAVARAKYLKLLLYVREPDDLRFIVTTLCRRFDVFANPDAAVAYLQAEYSWFYESGRHDIGFRFELELLEILTCKGAGIRVVCAGSRVTTNRPGQSQEIDLHLLVTNPDDPSEAGEIFAEVFSGTDNGDKGDQLDNYARAASRHQKAVLFINNSGRDEVEIHSPRYFVTPSGKHVWRLTYAQIGKMDPATLQRTLWRAYVDYRRRYF